METLVNFIPVSEAGTRRYRVALLIETSNAYARGLLRGIYGHIRDPGSWASFFPDQSRGVLPLRSPDRWRWGGVIARIQHNQPLRALAKLGVWGGGGGGPPGGGFVGGRGPARILGLFFLPFPGPREPFGNRFPRFL